MLEELTSLLKRTPEDASLEALARETIEHNLLDKPTLSSRKKSFELLRELYGLDHHMALFRVLRYIAKLDPDSLPLMALVCVYCRDLQLRASVPLIQSLKVGEVLTRERVEVHFESTFPGRFSAAFKKSLAQNINAAWTSVGYLSGRTKKVRTNPAPRPLASAYALIAGYLSGLRGQRLFASEFAEIVCPQASLLPSQLSLAASRGILGYKHAGGIVEFDFSPILTIEELTLADVTD